MFVMRIRDSKVITRANVTAPPMPDAFISQLNQEAQWDAIPTEDRHEPQLPTPQDEQRHPVDQSIRTVTNQPVDANLRQTNPEGEYQGHQGDQPPNEEQDEPAPEHDQVISHSAAVQASSVGDGPPETRKAVGSSKRRKLAKHTGTRPTTKTRTLCSLPPATSTTSCP